MAVYPVLSLASGGGGLDLGVELALPGTRTVCYVENEVTACAYLVESIRAGFLPDAPVWTDLESFDARPWRGLVDGIIGGYPCQPFSVAGKRLGTEDPRHLWPYIADIVRAVEPRWCFFENVSGHLRLGFREVAEDLRAMGYRVAATLWRAEEVGAPHRRERLFILAVDDSDEGRRRWGADAALGGAAYGWRGPQPEGGRSAVAHAISGELRDESGWSSGQGGAGAPGPRDAGEALAHADERDDDGGRGRGPRWWAEPANGGLDVGDADSTRLAVGERVTGMGRQESSGPARPFTWPPGPTSDAWAGVPERYWPATPQPAVRGLVDGLARADLLRIYGNGVVPQQAAAAFRELWDELTGGGSCCGA